MSPTPPSRGPPSRHAPGWGGDPTIGGDTVSDEGAHPMPPDPSDVVLRSRGGTLEPVTGSRAPAAGSADVVRLWGRLDAFERRLFRAESGVVVALLLWLGTMVLACAGAGWRLAGS